MKGFQIAGGSVPGTEHTKPGQPGWVNNQDAFGWQASHDFIIAVVCDGCSSAPHSEVGAKIGAQLVVRFFSECLTRSSKQYKPWSERITEGLRWTQMNVAREVALLAQQMGGSCPQAYERALLNYFLFTIIGAVITRDETAVFSLGDGVYAVNNEVKVIAQYEGNAPPYLAYTHIPSIKYHGGLDLQINMAVPTKDVSSVLIGSDGVADFVTLAASLLPGKREALGPIEQFWTDDKFTKNPDAIRRRLAVANRELAEDGHIKKGLLPDDATLVVIRREPQPEE